MKVSLRCCLRVSWPDLCSGGIYTIYDQRWVFQKSSEVLSFNRFSCKGFFQGLREALAVGSHGCVFLSHGQSELSFAVTYFFILLIFVHSLYCKFYILFLKYDLWCLSCLWAIITKSWCPATHCKALSILFVFYHSFSINAQPLSFSFSLLSPQPCSSFLMTVSSQEVSSPGRLSISGQAFQLIPFSSLDRFSSSPSTLEVPQPKWTVSTRNSLHKVLPALPFCFRRPKGLLLRTFPAASAHTQPFRQWWSPSVASPF